MTAGGGQTCGLWGNGVAYCWGGNAYGQLGDGSTTNRPTPVAVAGGLSFTSLILGDGHTCGLAKSGAAYCWGYNYYGQLGQGSYDLSPHPIPAPVAGDLRFKSLSAGASQTCGLTTSGVAYCWGFNHYGELGIGSSDDAPHPTPTPLVGGFTFASLTTGGDHTCGLTSSGAAYCWGDNEAGELGIGSSDASPHSTPTRVAGGLTFVRPTLGRLHTCALTTGGTAYCWGWNTSDQLGTGDTVPATVPGAVAGGLTFVSLSADGSDHTCGLTNSGAAYCWGSNGAGEVGDSTRNNMRVAPVAVTGGHTFVGLTTGSGHTCALTGAGAAYCWGSDGWGQLGDGVPEETARWTPGAVAGGLVFTSLAAGAYHTCALTGAGAAYCWGRGGDELGDGSTMDRAAPGPVAGGIAFTSIAAGFGHVCGLTSGGAAYCWGDNGNGQLGEGTFTPRPTPVPVTGGLAFASLAAGNNHTCGVTSNGVAYCWGENQGGEVGDNSNVDRATPVVVSGGLTFASLAPGGLFTCGLTTTGAAYCWGVNNAGQLGDGSSVNRAAPVAVAGGLTFVSLAADWDHVCGVVSGGAAYCWGDNAAGELGNGTAGNVSKVPALVAGGLTFASLVAGAQHTCGVTGSGAAYCWGTNTPRADSAPIPSTPVAVPGGLTYTRLATGIAHTCGLTSAGAAFCWGDNTYGQLGDDKGPWALGPVAVANP